MSTLDTNVYKKQSRIYIFVTIFVLIFSLIYEYFSHEVYSPYMLLAPLIPLIFGTILNYILYFSNIKLKIYSINNNIHNSLILCLLLGTLFKGALDIYGTTNKLIIIYLLISIILFVLNIIILLKHNLIINKQKR